MINTEEIWKPIEGYGGRYEVSSHGRIRSFAIDSKNGRIIKGVRSKLGYQVARLYDGKRNSKLIPIHRLVAYAFLDNPAGLPEVNHIDEIKHHNWVSNLEWCSRAYNVNYGTRNARSSRSHICHEALSLKVGSIDENGLVEYFDSIGEAERQTGCSHSNIIRTLKGRTNHCGNRQWFYL